MKPFSPHAPLKTNPSQPPLNRGGANSALPLFEAGSQQSCGVPASIPLAGVRGSRRGFNTSPYLKNLFLSLTLFAFPPAASAEPLGRLFFTPEQRQQMDYGYARNATADGGSSAVLTVNGIVQKDGGARTVWVNGMAQNANNNGERSPTAQTVNVPGKAQPVKLKVGQKILLDQPAPASPGLPAE